MIAKERALQWLQEHEGVSEPKKGGGNLDALTQLYLSAPKTAADRAAKVNVYRLRTICRKSLGRELDAVTAREVGPDLWVAYQRACITDLGGKLDYATRRRENITINSAIRLARSIFIPPLIRIYEKAGFSFRSDCNETVMRLPEPEITPAKIDDTSMLTAWAKLRKADIALWLVVGIARFAGLRRDEIKACRAGWLEGGDIVLRDRPEEGFQTKTGKSWRAPVINPELRAYLEDFAATNPPDTPVVPDPKMQMRAWWFERVPQDWLKKHGIIDQKPLHRLRKLYADHQRELMHELLDREAKGVKAAQDALGHTTPATTKRSYLSR